MLLHDHENAALAVAEIAQLDLPDADLAFLSACNTTDTAPRLVDEAVHVTGAFHLAGYRHVIGTLTPVNATAARVAAAVYGFLTLGGTVAPDTAETALALHHAVRLVRQDHLDAPRPGSMSASEEGASVYVAEVELLLTGGLRAFTPADIHVGRISVHGLQDDHIGVADDGQDVFLMKLLYDVTFDDTPPRLVKVGLEFATPDVRVRAAWPESVTAPPTRAARGHQAPGVRHPHPGCHQPPRRPCADPRAHTNSAGVRCWALGGALGEAPVAKACPEVVVASGGQGRPLR